MHIWVLAYVWCNGGDLLVTRDVAERTVCCTYTRSQGKSCGCYHNPCGYVRLSPKQGRQQLRALAVVDISPSQQDGSLQTILRGDQRRFAQCKTSPADTQCHHLLLANKANYVLACAAAQAN